MKRRRRLLKKSRPWNNRKKHKLVKNVHIGCSGWNYGHWKGRFYGRKTSSEGWFAEYSSIFSTVEINNTFYRLPEPSTFKSWEKQAPENFIYAVKANRYITHMKKLKDPRGPVDRFLGRAGMLGGHLGPVLFQLPPRWRVNPERLDAFTDILPGRIKCVFEFRDPSWYRDDIYRILERKKMSLCLHDMKGSASPVLPVGPVCYIRFHGTTGLYGGKYPVRKLREWAGIIKEQATRGREVYAYFNNDAGANAPKDAIKLKEMLGC